MSQMPAPLQHPNLNLRVTEPQRERALAYLQGAYADGRLTAEELDHRVGQALLATTRGELNQAFAGLVHIPLSSAAVGAHPAYAPVLNQHRDGVTGRFTASVAHFSGAMTMFVGPAVMYALTSRDTYANREAAKAFNFQVTMLGAMVVAGTLLQWLPLHGFLMAMLGLSWFVLSIVGGLRASKGEDWVNPVNRVVPLRVLDDRSPHRRHQLGR